MNFLSTVLRLGILAGLCALFSGFSRDAQPNHSLLKGQPYLKDTLPGSDLNKIADTVEVEASVDLGAWRRHLEKELMPVINKAAKKRMKPGQYIVTIRFLVEKDGSISDVKALNDPGYGLAEGAEKVLKKGPKWTPGKVNGRIVRSYHSQAITFVISP